MVSAGIIIALVLVAGFLIFGGLQITKDAVAETKKTVKKVRSETEKRIDGIKSDDE